MQSVNILVNQSILADTFNSMREWLDHYNFVLMNFNSTAADENDTVILHANFDSAGEATAFYKRFQTGLHE
jgi:hypothetical protein